MLKYLTLRTFFIFTLSLILYNCTTTVTVYETETGDSWIPLNKDSIAAMGFYVDLLNNEPGANAVFYTTLSNLNYYKSVDIGLEDFVQDTMDIAVDQTAGTDQWYFSGKDWEHILPEIKNTKELRDTTLVSLSCNRRYKLNPLPDKLLLHYHITTSDTVVDGKIVFIKTETEIPSVMRWH